MSTNTPRSREGKAHFESEVSSDSKSDELKNDVVPTNLSSDTRWGRNSDYTNPELLRPDAPEFTHPICQRCQGFDLPSRTDIDVRDLDTKGHFVAALGSKNSFSSFSKCPLCCLLASHLDTWHDTTSDFILEMFPFFPVYRGINYNRFPSKLKEKEIMFLFAYPRSLAAHKITTHFFEKCWLTGYAICSRGNSSRHRVFAAKAVSSTFDAPVLSNWIDYCKSHHGSLCSSQEPQLSGLKVINCNSLKVEPAPSSCSYTALSYVWCKSKSRNPSEDAVGYTHESGLGLSFSKVVRDSITVTKALGMQYLWVDKYCIDQDNSEERQDQIRKMDLVYKGAHFTIVAVGGNDESAGLPGVGGTPRTQQQMAKVGDLTIIDTMKHPHHVIETSTWWTRAWTLQEAIFSRRCVVFTEGQMYFECGGMNCYESLQSSLDLLHEGDEKFQPYMLSGMFGGKERGAKFSTFGPDDSSLEKNFCRYQALVENYTSRLLTYDSDSLNAFSGIMKHFEQEQCPVLQLCGVPFVLSKDSQLSSEDYFVAGLLWYHTRSNFDGSKGPNPRRRSGFPSWSWAGWAGKVGFQGRLPYWDRFLRSLLRSIHLESQDGHVVDHIDDFFPMSEMENLGHQTIRTLHINAWGVVSEAFTSSSDTTGDRNIMVGRYRTTPFISQGTNNQNILLTDVIQNEVECIVVGECESTVHLLAVRVQTGHALRIGVIWVHCSWENFRKEIKMIEKTVCLK